MLVTSLVFHPQVITSHPPSSTFLTLPHPALRFIAPQCPFITRHCPFTPLSALPHPSRPCITSLPLGVQGAVLPPRRKGLSGASSRGHVHEALVPRAGACSPRLLVALFLNFYVRTDSCCKTNRIISRGDMYMQHCFKEQVRARGVTKGCVHVGACSVC